MGRSALTAVIASFALLAAPATAAPAMWRVSDDNSSIVLFGSIHGLPPDISSWRTPLFDATLAQAQSIWFETDVGPAGMAALTVKTLVQAFSAQQAEDWTSRLSSEEADKLTAALAKLNISLEQAGRMPPWLVAMQLSQLQMQMPGDAQLDYSKGVDFVLEWELPAERKAFFETPGEQFDMLAGGTLEDQITQVTATLDQLDVQSPSDMAVLLNAWASGDVAGIADIVTQEGESDPAFIENLLKQRNRNWLPKIEGMLKNDQQTLVIVGAAHLVGTDSVIDLLQKAGYSITRIQ